MFAATGWRVGWLIGPESIIKPTLAATTRIVFCSNSPLQEAAAAGIEEVKDRKFFEIQLSEYQERRDILTACFDKLGLSYTHPEGTYFILLVSSSGRMSTGHSYKRLIRISRESHGPITIHSQRVFRVVGETSSTFYSDQK